MYLVVGLGNPGRKYQSTRHNAGFLIVDRLAERWSAPCTTRQLGALVSKALIASHPAVLCKPQGYMNCSGQPAVSLRGYYKVADDQIVVIHDDVDIPFGEVRVKQGGGHGGHNGLRDLVQKLGGGGFVRVRVGVSRPPEGWDTADYVLGRWTPAEQAEVDAIVDRGADAVEAVLRMGVVDAMNHFNVRSRRGSEELGGATDTGT